MSFHPIFCRRSAQSQEEVRIFTSILFFIIENQASGAYFSLEANMVCFISTFSRTLQKSFFFKLWHHQIWRFNVFWSFWAQPLINHSWILYEDNSETHTTPLSDDVSEIQQARCSFCVHFTLARTWGNGGYQPQTVLLTEPYIVYGRGLIFA